MSNVIKMPKPKTYTKPEQLIESVRRKMFGAGVTNKVLANKVGVSSTTIGNLMSGKTRWPRPTTLFPLLDQLNAGIALYDKSTGKRIDD